MVKNNQQSGFFYAFVIVIAENEMETVNKIIKHQGKKKENGSNEDNNKNNANDDIIII